MINDFIKSHFWKFVIFCFIGFAAFIIDWTFFNIFYRLNIGFILSRVFSAAISMIFNFNVNRNLTFKAGHHPIKQQVAKWLLVYTLAIGLNVSVGKLVLILLGESLLNANIAFFAGIAVAIPISFLGSLLWAFKEKSEQ